MYFSAGAYYIGEGVVTVGAPVIRLRVRIFKASKTDDRVP